jgi:hypothetical protein
MLVARRWEMRGREREGTANAGQPDRGTGHHAEAATTELLQRSIRRGQRCLGNELLRYDVV